MEKDAPTVDDLLDDIGIGWFQYRLLIVCGLTFMCDAMEVFLLSFLSICAGNDFDLTNRQIALISSAAFAGILVGSFVWGPIADVFGRKISLISAFSVIVIFGVLTGFSPNYVSLLVFQTLTGFGIGGLKLSSLRNN